MTPPGGSPDRVWTSVRGDVYLRVRLSPNGGCDQIGGVKTLADGRKVLIAKVRAVPEKGRANAALEKLIARALGVAKSSVEVAWGHKDRIKTLIITGDDAGLAAKVNALQKKE